MTRRPRNVREARGVCARDPVAFVSQLKVYDKPSRMMIPWRLWPEQRNVLDAVRKHRRIIVLKARQMGVSNIVRAATLHAIHFTNQPRRAVVVAHRDKAVVGMIRIDRRIMRNMPPWLHRPLLHEGDHGYEYKGSHAGVEGYTAGGLGGSRSDVAVLAHLTEFAYYRDGESVLAGVESTVGDTGRVIVESTVAGPSGYYRELVEQAQRPESPWHLVFFPWFAHAAYATRPPEGFAPTAEEQERARHYSLTPSQLAWRRKKIETIGELWWHREFPSTPEEAFQAAEGVYLPGSVIASISTAWHQQPPAPDRVYAGGADVGGGVGGDYSTLFIVDVLTGELAYFYASNTLTPVQFAEHVAKTGRAYNVAKLLVESNNHGHVVLLRMRQLGYMNLWRSIKGKDWVTTEASKLEAFERMKVRLAEYGRPSRLPRSTVMQLQSLAVKPGKLAPEGLGKHDDEAVGLALALRCAEDVRPGEPRYAGLARKPAVRY